MKKILIFTPISSLNVVILVQNNQKLNSEQQTKTNSTLLAVE